MTKFTAYYNLCPIQDPKEFLGISPDQEEGNIITTLNKNIIIIIKISTQKQIRSWSVTEKLSTKVVYDGQSHRYVGVFGQRALRCWDEHCEDVNKCKKLKFKKSIADLVTIGDSTYVLYHDGTCELLNKAIQSRKEQADETQGLTVPSSTRIFDSKAFKLANGQEVVTFFERQSENDELMLVRLNIEDGCASNLVRFKISRPSQPDYTVKPTGYAVVEGEDALTLMSIWTDNSIYMLKLDDSVETTSAPGKFVARMSTLRVDSQLTVIGVSKNFVAIYGANNGQEGASLLLYNTKFQVIKTKQFFKVYLDFSRLWSVGQYILIAMGQNLSVVSYSKSPDLIADLLGSQANNNFDNYIDCDHINEEEPLQENIRFVGTITDDTSMECEGENQSIVPSNLEFADGNLIPFEDVADFDETLNMLSRLEMSTEVVKVEHALEDVRITLMSDSSDTGFVTREVELIAQQLENCGASESEITEKLLTLLLKANLLADVIVCLRRYSNISGKMLVKVLKYGTEQYSKTKASDLPEAICNVLYAAFSCEFNPNSIEKYLRHEIEYDSVVLLMYYLYNLLENCDDSKYCTRPSPQGFVNDVVQFELQIINWFSILLSSHFQKLVLSKDIELIELLYKWHELCEGYKTLVGDLQDTAALLYNIVNKKEALKQKTSTWYTIEEVCLW